MLRQNLLNLFSAAFAATILFASIGCDSADPNAQIMAVNKTNMERLVNLYERHQTQNKWMGPSDETEFKEYISAMDEPSLTRMGIDPGTVDDLFISERDNEPFKIRYKVKGSARGSNEAIIFESVGVEGTRLVAFTSRQTEEVTSEKRYKDLFSGKAKEAAFKPPEIPKGDN